MVAMHEARPGDTWNGRTIERVELDERNRVRWHYTTDASRRRSSSLWCNSSEDQLDSVLYQKGPGWDAEPGHLPDMDGD